ncbi:unnamed protein product [Medioppia subpectinata]|uniref:Protein kinase domain-containing protein n=1 Tax=Medioppia subpectinata TaxID=1979941 RepID=A0A7R9KTD9_9ACAR|nr:unnamed protein product [Medioppia subpectinata]CAG2109501.1 unnamed protein product [Medioppia subpectinata]
MSFYKNNPKTGGKVEPKDYKVNQEVRSGDNRVRLGQLIDSGTFGEIRKGVILQTNERVIVKLEPNHKKQLEMEYKICKDLDKDDGFPRVYFYCQWNEYNVLVTEVLGPSLSEMFDTHNSQFNPKTVLYIVFQLIHRIEKLHGLGFIIRDINPDTLVLGPKQTKKESIVHFTDFSLVKRYTSDPNNPQKHIPMTSGHSLNSWPRYASINAHLGLEVSRRDDMESIGYLIVYFATHGKLLWTDQGFTGDVKQQIGEYKRCTPIERLCSDIPNVFAKYLRIVRNLEFDERPEYMKLKLMFYQHFLDSELEDDGLYIWSTNAPK